MVDEPDRSSIESSRDDVNVDPLPRMDFAERAANGEPESDRFLTLDDGTCTRERIVMTDSSAADTLGDVDAAPTSFTLCISHALTDDKGAVQRSGEAIMLAPVHEVSLTLDALGRLGSTDAAREAINDIRRMAAAQAANAFRGANIAADLLGDRGISATM